MLEDFLACSAAYGDRYYPLWVALATTGARGGEILGLRWQDLDLKRGRPSLIETVVAVNHQVLQGEAPKALAGERTISIDPQTVAVLKVWKARQAEERLILGAGYRATA